MVLTLTTGGKQWTQNLIKNFNAASTTLCKIWEDLIIDGYQTVAEFNKNPPSELTKSFAPTAAFRERHVFET